MDSASSLIRETILSGIATTAIQDDAVAESESRMSKALQTAKGRMILFLGAAISTFKPAQLPMWNEFVKLLWTSSVDVAFPAQELGDSQIRHGLLDYFQEAKGKVPNYMVTEVIARRLGMGYLNVLEAFQAQRDELGEWAVNHVHMWVARCLSLGSVTAVLTTNFDDYIERALEVSKAISYQVTGDHEVDDYEISSRLRIVTSSSKLVLIVNGAKALAFIRSLMPHLGGGKITFLFKLHGSCYDPPTCIDTRLQRSQGLPSFATDILDTLLKRAVWLVAGFSGSDMNDNLDYLRFLSNKQHARIFWTSVPGPYQESSIDRLTSLLPYNTQSESGLSHMRFWFQGERISAADNSALFDRKIARWAQGLGSDWCRLILIDLVKLFEKRSPGHKLNQSLVQHLVRGEDLRQDWNPIINSMNDPRLTHQTETAKNCAAVWSMLSDLNFDTSRLSRLSMNELCTNLSTSLARLRSLQYDFGSQELRERTEPIHAQAWVLSALSGLIMLVAGQPTASLQAFERSSTMSRLVGDDEMNRLIVSMIAAIRHNELPFSTEGPLDEQTNTLPAECCIMAFSPDMDNVNSKMNAAGIPPAVYIRALLHRSLLFADFMAVMPNTVSNSTVFVDEIIFQGEINKPDMTYIRHLLLVLPHHLRDKPKKLTEFRKSRRKGYLYEPVDETHLNILDEYFDDPRHAHQIFYYDEGMMGSKYGDHIGRQVHKLHRRHTTQHLVQHWYHRGRRASAPAATQQTESQSVHSVAEDLLGSIAKLIDLFNGRTPTRSELYKFADLFDEASDDPRTFLKELFSEITEAQITQILSARERIVSRPWVYGPLCHELFDIPYRANTIFSLQEQLQRNFHMFLEEADMQSWQYTASMRTSPSGANLNVQPCTSQLSQHCSALLLSQLPRPVLLRTRQQLRPTRERISRGEQLSDEDVVRLQAVVDACTTAPETLPEVPIEELVQLDEKTKQAARQLLRHCIFLVRRGSALDPMYEEARISIPSLFTLSASQA